MRRRCYLLCVDSLRISRFWGWCFGARGGWAGVLRCLDAVIMRDLVVVVEMELGGSLHFEGGGGFIWRR